MKIIYLHQYFNTPKMNGGTRSYEIARRLAEVGHEVHIISSYRENDRPTQQSWVEKLQNFTVHWIVIPYSNKFSYSKRILAFIRFAWAASRKAYQIKGDIVFATSTPLTIALPGIYASKRLKIPMVFEVRDLWPELPIAIGAIKNPLLIFWAKWLERLAYHNSSHIIALSPGMAEGIRLTGYSRRKITVIPNGADIELFSVNQTTKQDFLSRYPKLMAGPIILYAGTLGIINGVDYLVDIAAEMKHINPKIKFLIVGDGKELHYIKKRAEEKKILNDNLLILPPVAKNEMGSILSAVTVATSLFIDIPEMWNNSANKFFDSMAAGKPIMINYGGWQANLLKESGAGLVVPPNQPAIAADMLHKFMANDLGLEKAGFAAKHLAETQFNRNILTKKLIAVLETVISS